MKIISKPSFYYSPLVVSSSLSSLTNRPFQDILSRCWDHKVSAMITLFCSVLFVCFFCYCYRCLCCVLFLCCQGFDVEHHARQALCPPTPQLYPQSSFSFSFWDTFSLCWTCDLLASSHSVGVFTSLRCQTQLMGCFLSTLVWQRKSSWRADDDNVVWEEGDSHDDKKADRNFPEKRYLKQILRKGRNYFKAELTTRVGKKKKMLLVVEWMS